MRSRVLALLGVVFVALTGTALAITKTVGRGCPPCPFCQ